MPPDYSAPYEAERRKLLRSFIPTGTGTAVDIGCHDGTMSDLLVDAGYEVVGYDLNAEAVQQARRNRPGRDFRVGSAKDAVEVYDRVITMCLEVLEHLPEEQQKGFLDELAEGSPQGSWLVLSTPMRHSLVATWERFRSPNRYRTFNWWDDTHVGVITWPKLRSLLAASGWQVEQRAGFHCLPFGTPFGSTRFTRLGFDLIVLARRV